MKNIGGVYFPDIDVSSQTMVEKSAKVAKHGFQLDSLRTALSHVTDWSLALDGGANIGTWTNELSEHFTEVISFELAPDTHSCLQKNVNEVWCLNNVTVFNKALSNQNTFVGVKEGDATNSRSGGRHVGSGNNIQSITIDELDLPNLGFLKLDLEGHEGQALQGAVTTLAKFQPVVLVEHKPKHFRRYGSVTLVETTLKDLGASLVEKTGPNEIDWIYKWI